MIQQLINDENEKKLKAAWNNSLGHQIQKERLPKFETVNLFLKELFGKIFFK